MIRVSEVETSYESSQMFTGFLCYDCKEKTAATADSISCKADGHRSWNRFKKVFLPVIHLLFTVTDAAVQLGQKSFNVLQRSSQETEWEELLFNGVSVTDRGAKPE